MRLPDQIGPYRIEARLGQGGMGLVFQARDPALPRAVALKVLSAELLVSDVARTRFQREAEALAKVTHPHVVRVHAAGIDDERPWIALDLVTGGSLQTRLDRGPLPPREAAALVAQLADAVEHVHRAGILHRDIKPDNVLLDERGSPRLTDFGLARGLSGELTRLSRTGAASGTPGYMAPEQVRGGADLGPAVDVYGLGGLLYALLTGGSPFHGTPMEVIVATLEREPSPPSKASPEVPAALDAICLRCLAKSPAARYPSAAALAADLQRFLAGAWTPRRRAGARLAAAVAVALAVAAAAMLAVTAASGPARPDASSAPTAPRAPSPARSTAPRDPAAALRALDELPPREALPALRAWLREHRDHPRADAARERVQRLAERPLWSVDFAPSQQPPRGRGTRVCAWAPGRLVAWRAEGNMLEVWDLARGLRLAQHAPEAPLWCVTPLDDETLVLGHGDGTLTWLRDGQEVRTVQAFSRSDEPSERGWGRAIEDLAVETPGQRVWAASHCGSIRAFDGRSGERVAELRPGTPARQLTLAGPTRLISATGWSVDLNAASETRSAQQALTLWALDRAAPLHVELLGWRPATLARAGDQLLLGDVNSQVRLFRLAGDAILPQGYLVGEGLASGADAQFLQGARALGGRVEVAVFDGDRVYAGGRDHAKGGELRCWRLGSGDELQRWAFPAEVSGVAILEDWLVIGTGQGHFEVFARPDD